MSLTRKYLKTLGLTEAQIEGVIRAHAETVDGLKEEIDSAKGDSDRLRQEYDQYRADAEQRRREDDVKAAYRKLLEREHVDPRRFEAIERATSYDAMTLDDAGALADSDKLAADIRRDWSDFIVTTRRRGAKVSTPPAGDRQPPSRREILSIRDTAQRQRAIAENHELFGF